MLKPKKYIASFILLTFFFSSISCNIKNSISDFDDRVIIAGTILNSEKNKISGIPRYVLVNKDGVVVDKNALRPSFEGELNTDLINEINSLIKD